MNPYSSLSFGEDLLTGESSLSLCIGTTDNVAAKPLLSLAEPEVFNCLTKSDNFSNKKAVAKIMPIIISKTSIKYSPLSYVAIKPMPSCMIVAYIVTIK